MDPTHPAATVDGQPENEARRAGDLLGGAVGDPIELAVLAARPHHVGDRVVRDALGMIEARDEDAGGDRRDAHQLRTCPIVPLIVSAPSITSSCPVT